MRWRRLLAVLGAVAFVALVAASNFRAFNFWLTEQCAEDACHARANISTRVTSAPLADIRDASPRQQALTHDFDVTHFGTTEETPSKITKVIIHAGFRTGSTFTSDFFYYHSDAHYLFEPFHLLSGDYIQGNTAEVLNDMLDCEYAGYWRTVQNTRTQKSKPLLNSWLRKCFCWGAKRWRCTIPGSSQRCLSKTLRIIKLIRVRDLRHLEPLMEEGVKVVQLVRDPRGVVNSILHEPRQLWNSSDIRSIAKSYCNRILRDVTYIKDHMKTRSFRDTYRLVRYEDLAMNTTRALFDLYNFIQYDPDASVLGHYNITTDNKHRDVTNDNHAVSHDGSSKESTPSYYNTLRHDSLMTSLSWKAQLPMDSVALIQGVCGELMSQLGYKEVTGNTPLTFDSIIAPLPIYSDSIHHR